MLRRAPGWVCTHCQHLKPSRPVIHKTTRNFHRSKRREVNSSLGEYYDLLLNDPQPDPSPSSTTTKYPQRATSDQEKRIAAARVVFGSRLAGPGDRRAERMKHAQTIAGVVVPPRPLEPDNCCMSGCVNCVWDQFRDELEEWVAKNREANSKIQLSTGNTISDGGLSVGAGSMDDDGGGSETNWSSGEDNLMRGIPVGIREFMRTEKRLKDKHARENA